MSVSTDCGRCGSQRVIRDKVIRDGGKGAAKSLYIIVGERKPEALILTGPVTTDIHATVCGDCGHVQLWVDEPRLLWDEYEKLSQRGGGPDRSERTEP